ncbi:MAG: GDP-mannose 4,6-dehydratase [Rhodanobacteraceae bacterium]
MTRAVRHALITGISGQDGAWLAARLLVAGIRVVGTHRPGTPDLWRLNELGIASHRNLQLGELDPRDADACRALLRETRVDAVFHLAAQSSVAESLVDPLGTVAANGASALNLLEAVRCESPATHVVIASSAQIFAGSSPPPFDEITATVPLGPYGVSKQLAHAAALAWRETWGLRASSLILFNHESELRGEDFVTRKISRAVARIALGRATDMALGNLDAQRDFGYAPDFIAAMARLAQRDEAGDFVLASGHSMSIRDFATEAFAAIDLALDWRGAGADEIGIERHSGTLRVRVDPALLRPRDVSNLVGNAARAQRELEFATTLDGAGIARRMVRADLARERGERVDHGVC